jgi:hypothetical protein
MIEDRPSMHLLGDLLHISKGDGGISFWERLLNFLNGRKEKQGNNLQNSLRETSSLRSASSPVLSTILKLRSVSDP